VGINFSANLKKIEAAYGIIKNAGYHSEPELADAGADVARAMYELSTAQLKFFFEEPFFFISPDGFVVTNRHVIEGASAITAVTNNSPIFLFERIFAQPAGVDLVVLKFQRHRCLVPQTCDIHDSS
jgi:S1-C subfamily serine protease